MKKEDYDRSVRGSIAAAPWEENAHAHKAPNKNDARKSNRSVSRKSVVEKNQRSAEAVNNERRETFGPPINRMEP